MTQQQLLGVAVVAPTGAVVGLRANAADLQPPTHRSWPARLSTRLRRDRTPAEKAVAAFSVACHAVIVGSVAYALPALWHAVETGGRPTCDLSHVTARQALTGEVCGQRLLDVRVEPASLQRGGQPHHVVDVSRAR